MRYFGKTLHPEYTDLAVVLGPNVRWVEDDYEDLQRFAPEVLLGYRVRLTTIDSVRSGHTRGLRIDKIVVLEGPEMYETRALQAVREIRFSQVGAYFPKVEWYRVHRGSDPVVQKLLF